MTKDTGPRYDYTNQAWIEHGVYVDCCHPAAMNCTCYGRKHAGEPAPEPEPTNARYDSCCAAASVPVILANLKRDKEPHR